jgi:hypothetical protein
MFSKTARVRVRRFHRWVAVIFGVQLIFWVTSGLYFAWMPIKVVKDEDRKAEIPASPLPLNRVVAPQNLALPPGFQTKTLRLDQTPAGLFYRLESTEGALQVFDALSGTPARYLSPGQIADLALQQIQTKDKPVAVNFLDTAPADYKGPLPVFQLVFDDFRKTHLYTDPWSGRVIVRRNMFWRVYDFLWMLHILDFAEREDFNNPWIRILSTVALTIIVSGYFLFFFGRPPRRV